MLNLRQRPQQHKVNTQPAELGLSASGYRLPETELVSVISRFGAGEHASLQAPSSPTVQMSARRPSRSRNTVQRNFLKWLNSAQTAIAWAVILVILAIASGVYLQQVSKTAIVGRNSELLDFQLTEMRYNNSQIRQRITVEQSLATMQERSTTSGIPFQEVNPVAAEYLQVVVEPPPIEAPAPARTVDLPPATIGEALKIYLLDYFATFGRGVADGR